MNFSLENLMTVLPIMGMGMLGIFAVTCVIIICVWLIGKITAKKDN